MNRIKLEKRLSLILTWSMIAICFYCFIFLGVFNYVAFGFSIFGLIAYLYFYNVELKQNNEKEEE